MLAIWWRSNICIHCGADFEKLVALEVALEVEPDDLKIGVFPRGDILYVSCT